LERCGRRNQLTGEEALLIEFKREGGLAAFPGLSKPVLIDTDVLPPADAARLNQLVGSARFFDQPAELGKPRPGAADYYQYTITIEAGGRRHTLRLSEPFEDPNLRALVNELQARATATRRAQQQQPKE
jgi:hypothetical protein